MLQGFAEFARDKPANVKLYLRALSFGGRVQLPGVIMRPLVISSCKLMKFEVLLQRREDAANDARKTSGRDCVADDQNAMQALVL